MAHVTAYVTGYVTYVNGLCKIRKHVACLLFIYLFIYKFSNTASCEERIAQGHSNVCRPWSSNFKNSEL